MTMERSRITGGGSRASVSSTGVFFLVPTVISKLIPSPARQVGDQVCSERISTLSFGKFIQYLPLDTPTLQEYRNRALSVFQPTYLLPPRRSREGRSPLSLTSVPNPGSWASCLHFYLPRCRARETSLRACDRSTFRLNLSDGESRARAPSPIDSSTMPAVSSHESKQPEEKSDYQDATDDVERAQVAKRWTRVMRKYGVEARGGLGYLWLGRDSSAEPNIPGILPVPPECRTDTQYNKIFFVWFSMNLNILSFVWPLARFRARLDSWLVSQVLGRDARPDGLWAGVARLVFGNLIFQYPLRCSTFVPVSVLGIFCLDSRVN